MSYSPEYKAKKAAYMNKEITHREFYQWMISVSQLPPIPKRFIESDKHIPLPQWDSLASGVRIPRGVDNSLASKVCMLKEKAQELRGKPLPDMEW